LGEFFILILQAFSYRNLCAHHGKIWNRTFTVKASSDKRYKVCQEEPFHQGKIYSQMVIIAILLHIIDSNNCWEKSVRALFSLFSHSYADDMGFPKNWTAFDVYPTP